MIRSAVIFAALLLSGCGSAKMLENRVTCTVDGSEAHIVSKWGRFSIGAQVAAGDAKVMCAR